MSTVPPETGRAAMNPPAEIPRVLVGTLYCGEREFADACRSIRSQTDVACEHFVIRDLPKFEAHQALYGRFMSSAGDCDFFMKVDADMVLSRPTFTREACDWFAGHPTIDNLQVAVDDFFTGGLLAGLHLWRSHVRWSDRDDRTFTDAWAVDADRRHTDFERLAPAATHCESADSFQAFHFGVHRGVKWRECLDRRGRVRRSKTRGYRNVIRSAQRRWIETGDRRLGFVVLGAYLALDRIYRIEDLNYGDPTLANHFRELADLPGGEIRRRIERMKRRHAWSTPLRWLRRPAA